MRLTRCLSRNLVERTMLVERALQEAKLPVQLMKRNSIKENKALLMSRGMFSPKYKQLADNISADSQDRPWVDTVDDINQPLHLLRSMLRECTYLTDPVCKSYIRSYIMSRYKEASLRYRTESSKATNAHGAITPPLWIRKRPKLLRDARAGLKLLQDANRGISEALTRVLFLGYGRIGKRRQELLAVLRRPDGEDNVRDLMQETAELAGLRKENQEDLPKIPPKLEALMRSHKATRVPGSQIKTLVPNIPKENSWGRATPQNRTKNMLIDWFKTLMNKIQPPLPDAEWEYLRKFATGELKFQGPIPRRHRGHRVLLRIAEEIAEFSPRENLVNSSDLETFADDLEFKPLRDVLRGQKPGGSSKSTVHQLTPRFVRRRYAELFEICPKLLWDRENMEWKYQWGKVKRKKSLRKHQALEADDSIFKVQMIEDMELSEAQKRVEVNTTLGSKASKYDITDLI